MNTAYVVMIRARISQICEITSRIYENKSIINYISKSDAINIQHKIEERKFDCLVLYGLIDDHFNTIFLHSLCDISRIASDDKKK